MRKWVTLGTLCVSFASASAHAGTIVQTISGTQRSGTPLVLFDPTLGQLDSVVIDGTLGFSEDLIRLSTGDPLPAVSMGRSAPSCLGSSITPVVSLGCTTLSGNESYPANSIFGSIILSGTLFSILTGADVTQFIAAGQSSVFVSPTLNSFPPLVGQINFNPGNGGTYRVTVTYNYSLVPVPEPSTWSLMLLGLGAVGVALRKRRLPKLVNASKGSRAGHMADT